MSYGDIKKALDDQVKLKEENEQLRAPSFINSFFYANDVNSAKIFCNSINDAIRELKSAINSIVSKINSVWESSFYNTRGDLVRISGEIPETFADELQKAVETASENAFNLYEQKYNTNYNQLNSLQTRATNYLSQYQKLESQVTSYEASKRREEHKTPVDWSRVNRYRKKIEECKNTMKSSLESASSEVEQMTELNKNNREELLEKGLRKA